MSIASLGIFQDYLIDIFIIFFLVQQIVEQLSEGIAQLTAIVITNKDTNAIAKPTFRPAVEVLIQSCNELGSVSRQVEKEYEDYPSVFC